MALCSGPCLPHCYRCPAHVVAASALSVTYVIACVYYYIVSRNIGTPFLDSLTEKQREIKKISSMHRYRIFLDGMSVGAISVAALWHFSGIERANTDSLSL